MISGTSPDKTLFSFPLVRVAGFSYVSDEMSERERGHVRDRFAKNSLRAANHTTVWGDQRLARGAIIWLNGTAESIAPMVIFQNL
jgi:hypothetical protein